MSEAVLYVIVAGIYGLLGAFLSVVYYFAARLRAEPLFHCLTGLVLLLAGFVAALGSTIEFENLGAFHRGSQFFLFFGASMFYVPVAAYLIVHYCGVLIEKITSPGSRQAPPGTPLTGKQEWQRIQTCLEALAMDPTSSTAHERLGDLYASMGFLDSAVYQYRKAADWIQTGYGHSQLLYKAGRILVEKKKDPASAIALLRRVVKLYPRSYFASYARRVINQFEAHNPPPERASERGEDQPQEPFFFPPGAE